jgi:GcrA cell cycle regulator
MGWTDERVETLKALWLDGLSASQIAKQLGGVTRNAVIGKVHRLGLSGRATPSQPSPVAFKPPRTRPAAPSPVMARRPAPPTAPSAPSSSTPSLEDVRPQPDIRLTPRREEPGEATVLTLGRHMCKWPIGDPSSSEFTFCGRRAADERPYCVEHAKLAYQPQQTKKKAGPNELARSLRRYI